MHSQAFVFVAFALIGCGGITTTPIDQSTDNASGQSACVDTVDQPQLFTSTNPTCTGCPSPDSPDFEYVGKPCGDPNATLCEVATSGGGGTDYISCCGSTWVMRGLVEGDAGKPAACP